MAVLKKKTPTTLPKFQTRSASEIKAVPKPITLPKKGAPTHAKEKPKEPEEKPASQSRPRKKTSKSAVSTGERTKDRELGRIAEAKESKRLQDTLTEVEGQMTRLAMLDLSFTAKHEKWKELNKTAPEHEYITLLVPGALPKELMREYPPKGHKSPSKEALWCCYCSEWMKFRTFSYTGYERCIGCGMSTKDFHIVRANQL
jgi:hypothetical protein